MPKLIIVNFYACMIFISLTDCPDAFAGGYSDLTLKEFVGATHISAQDQHVCGIVENKVRCESLGYIKVEPPPSDLQNPRQLAAGAYHGCALTDHGVRCWGSNKQGQATPPADLKNPRQITSGYSHSCALTDEGVRCWGSNYDKQINVPSDLKNPTAISAYLNSTCALVESADGNGVRCWPGQLESTPQSGLHDVKQFSVGTGLGCALTGTGVHCWDLFDFETKKLVNPKQVVVGKSHACALTDEGVRCWGDNVIYKELVPPKDLKNPTLLIAAHSESYSVGYICAATDDGLRCWGKIK